MLSGAWLGFLMIVDIIMVTLCNRADHYIFALWFLSSFFLLFFTPNLSGRRLDVYHTSAHGVALVQIYNVYLKCAARGLLKIQDTKNRLAPWDNFVGLYLTFFSFFFFPRLISSVADGYVPYFYTWRDPSANLECRSETCCSRLAENTGRKKSTLWHHRTTLSSCIFAAEACIDNQKKTS